MLPKNLQSTKFSWVKTKLMCILTPLDCDRVNENLDVTTMTYYLRQCNIHDSYLGPRQFLFNAIAKMLIL